MTKALLVIDIQKDFLEGGSLAVKDSNQIISKVVKLIKEYKQKEDYIFMSLDSHPENHCSFVDNHEGKKLFDKVDVNGIEQILWPKHCVFLEEGWSIPEEIMEEFDEILDTEFEVVYKGRNEEIDSYSAFFDNDKKTQTPLDIYLKEKGITEIEIVGLATDYCVKYTAMDAKALGYDVTVLVDACKGVDEKTTKEAIEEMRANNITIKGDFQ